MEDLIGIFMGKLTLLTMLLFVTKVSLLWASEDNQQKEADDKNPSADSLNIKEDNKNAETNVPITEYILGSSEKDPKYTVDILVVPTCTHCAQFMEKDLDTFLKNYGQIYTTVVKFVPASIPDIFIINLANIKSKTDDFYTVISYIMKALSDNAGKISITSQDKEKFQSLGFENEELYPYIKMALSGNVFQDKNLPSFIFTEEEIISAMPDSNRSGEEHIMMSYAKYSMQIEESGGNNGNPIDFPYIIIEGKHVSGFPSNT